MGRDRRLRLKEEGIMFQPKRSQFSEVDAVGVVPPLAPAEVFDISATKTTPLAKVRFAWLLKVAFLLVGLLFFIIALQLLKQGAGSYGRQIIGFLQMTNATNSLGFGWLLAYVFLSGSPVAAVAVSFFASGTINALQTFTMITGSRLGASFIVLFVGFIYYLRGHQRSASISIGVLALLTTAAIYLPALVLGYWLLSSQLLDTIRVNTTTPLTSLLDAVVDPIVHVASRSLPGWGLLLLGVALLLTAFSLLDRALPEMSPERSAFRRIGRLVYRPAAMFLLGAVVTSMTLSVSVSLSILVPLSSKGLVRRENTLPYIMGANVTTFIDTLVAALITGGPAAFTIVLVEMVSVALLSLFVLLLCYRPFERSLLRLQEIIIHNNLTLSVFLAVMLVVPLFLLLVK
jgi:hypothetical protein